jgi:hypothetical protein
MDLAALALWIGICLVGANDNEFQGSPHRLHSNSKAQYCRLLPSTAGILPIRFSRTRRCETIIRPLAATADPQREQLAGHPAPLVAGKIARQRSPTSIPIETHVGGDPQPTDRTISKNTTQKP